MIKIANSGVVDMTLEDSPHLVVHGLRSDELGGYISGEMKFGVL